MEEAVFVQPSPEEIALFEKLLPIANPAHKHQAQLISGYDLAAASRYLSLVVPEPKKKRRKAFFPKINEKA